MPAVETDIFASGLVLELSSPTGIHFTLSSPSNHDVNVIVDLQFCTNGAYPNASEGSFVSATTSIELHGYSTSSENIYPFEVDQSSVIYLETVSDKSEATSDGRCFSIQAVSGPVQSPIIFQTVYITYQVNALSRRRSSSASIYQPVGSGAVVIDAVPQSFEYTLYSDPGSSITVKDLQSPRFANCPTNGIVATAAPGELSAVVTWPDVQAYDNVAMSARVRLM